MAIGGACVERSTGPSIASTARLQEVTSVLSKSSARLAAFSDLVAFPSISSAIARFLHTCGLIGLLRALLSSSRFDFMTVSRSASISAARMIRARCLRDLTSASSYGSCCSTGCCYVCPSAVSDELAPEVHVPFTAESDSDETSLPSSPPAPPGTIPWQLARGARAQSQIQGALPAPPRVESQPQLPQTGFHRVGRIPARGNLQVPDPSGHERRSKPATRTLCGCAGGGKIHARYRQSLFLAEPLRRQDPRRRAWRRLPRAW